MKPPYDIRSPGRDLNPGSPEYEAGALTTQPRRSVTNFGNASFYVAQKLVLSPLIFKTLKFNGPHDI
jgi:hypothetical protein